MAEAEALHVGVIATAARKSWQASAWFFGAQISSEVGQEGAGRGGLRERREAVGENGPQNLGRCRYGDLSPLDNYHPLDKVEGN